MHTVICICLTVNYANLYFTISHNSMVTIGNCAGRVKIAPQPFSAGTYAHRINILGTGIMI
jgi:hypothetical protein